MRAHPLITAGLCTLTAAVISLACGKQTPPTTPPATTAAPQTEAAASADACKSWAGFDASTQPALPDTPYTKTFEQVWATVLTKHYDPTLGCLDWPAIRVEYGSKLAEAKDEAAAYGLMNQMLGRLKQSHLAVVPPGRARAGEPRGGTVMGPATVPARVRVVEGVVTVVDPKVGGKKSGLPGGAQIVAVDEVEVAPLQEGMKGRFHRPIEADFRIAATVQQLLTCPEGGKKVVRFLPHGADKEKKATLKCTMLERERVSMGNLEGIPVEVEARMIPKTKVGYVRWNVWLLPLMAKIEAGIADLREKGMESLVIDLRGNPGGVGMMVVPVGRLLLSQSADLGVMHMREGNQKFAVTAGEDPFAGRIVVLVDEGTGSTSEIFAQALHDLGRIEIYGAGPSQGAALPSLIEKLESGAVLQYVVADYKSPKDVSVEGRGVEPDHKVPEARADYAAGKDPVLDAALAALTAPAAK
jgi:carboxyl-terminal processing protease